MTNPVVPEEEFDWVQFKKDYAVDHSETRKEKLYRKLGENPLVPIGCLATSVALGLGLWNFRKGNSRMSQNMMRMRIGAQGFTVIAIMIGVGMTMAKTSSS